MAITITEKRVQDQSSSALNIKDIINIVYPVGSIYMSVNDTDPSLLFHGTWERIKDRFLLASGDTYSAGSTGGEATHTLNINEMPPYLTVYMWKRIAYEDSVVLSLQNGRLVMYRSKVSQDGINFILSNHKNLIVMHTDKVDFDIVDHQRLEASYK